MRKFLIILAVFLSCENNDDNTVLVPEKCDCVKELIQVTIDNRHIVQGSENVRILCEDDGKEFNQVYSNNKLIQYKRYKCN